jgi:hypothetical protein
MSGILGQYPPIVWVLILVGGALLAYYLTKSSGDAAGGVSNGV